MKVAHAKIQISLGIYNAFMSIFNTCLKDMRIEEGLILEVNSVLDKSKIDIVNTLDNDLPLIDQVGGPEKLK